MSAEALAALFGRIFNDGVELDLSGGINYKDGIEAVLNEAEKRIDVRVGGSSLGSAKLYDDVQSMRDASGAKADDMAFTKGYSAAGGGGSGLWVYSADEAPGTYTDNGGTVVVPSGGDGSGAWLRQYDGPAFAEWFGAVGDNSSGSATANTAALQALVDWCQASGDIASVGPGAFYVDSGIVVDTGRGFTFSGAGGENVPAGTENGTMFKWVGPDDEPFIDLRDSRRCLLVDWAVTAQSGFPLMAGVRSFYAGVNVASRNQLKRLRIHGTSPSEPNLGVGFLVDKDAGAPDSNNSEHEVHNSVFSYYGTASGTYTDPAAIKITHSQARETRVVKCGFVAGDDAAYAYKGHTDIYFEKCNGAGNDIEFNIDQINGPLTAADYLSEGGNQFLVVPSASSGTTVNLLNCDYGGGDRTDPYVIEFLCGGSLNIVGGVWDNDPGQILAGAFYRNKVSVQGAVWATASGADVWPVVQSSNGSEVVWFGNQRDRANGGGRKPWADRFPIPSGPTDLRPDFGLYEGQQWGDTSLRRNTTYLAGSWWDGAGNEAKGIKSILGGTLETLLDHEATDYNSSGYLRLVDLSGNAYHHDAPDSDAEPTITADGLVFDGVDDIMQCIAAANVYKWLHDGSATTAAAWLVCEMVTNTTSYLVANASLGATQVGFGFLATDFGTQRASITNGTSAFNATSVTGLASAQPIIMAAEHDGSDLDLTTIAAASTTAGTVSLSSLSSSDPAGVMTIGRRGPPNTTTFTELVFKQLVFALNPSAQQITDVTDYLKTKYQLPGTP